MSKRREDIAETWMTCKQTKGSLVNISKLASHTCLKATVKRAEVSHAGEEAEHLQLLPRW